MKTPRTNTITGNDVDTEPYRPQSDPTIARPTASRLASARDVYEALADLRTADQEHFVAFDLDVRHRVIARRVVHVGTLTGVEVHPREVFKPAIVNSAAAIIIAHNHPSGDPSPSRQDIELTERLRDAGSLIGIAILDHVVFAAEGFVSLAERYWR
jgi:DNA repair protein RadC